MIEIVVQMYYDENGFYASLRSPEEAIPGQKANIIVRQWEWALAMKDLQRVERHFRRIGRVDKSIPQEIHTQLPELKKQEDAG